MIPTNVENTIATEEVEVVLAVEIVEVGTFCSGIDFIEADCALNFDERTIDVLIMEIVVLPKAGEDCVFEIEIGHRS
jgi:hypothetical protein